MRPKDLFCDPQPDKPTVLLHVANKWAVAEQFAHLSTEELVKRAKNYLDRCGCPTLAHSVGDRATAHAFLKGVTRPIRGGRVSR